MTDQEMIRALAVEANERGLLPDVPANEAEEDALYIVRDLLDGDSENTHDLRIVQGYLERLINLANNFER